MQVGATPAQRVEALQHVVADRDIGGAQLEHVERKRLPVVQRCKEAHDAADLSGVALVGQAPQARERLRAGGRGRARTSLVLIERSFDLFVWSHRVGSIE